MRALRPLVEAPSGPEAGEPTLLRKLNLQGNGIDSNTTCTLLLLYFIKWSYK